MHALIGCCLPRIFRNLLCSAVSMSAMLPGQANSLHANGDNCVEEAKKLAACRSVQNHVKSGNVIGVGTGSTTKYVVDCLAEAFKAGDLKNIICVPTSFQARHLIIDNGLPLSDLERNPVIDICIDGADEVDKNLCAIKGGGGCLTQEKIVMSCSRRFIIVADYRKQSERLGNNFSRLPLEVVPAAYVPVRTRIAAQEGGECVLRMAQKKAGPVITDNGNYVLDWLFPKEKYSTPDCYHALHTRLKLLPGMVETGLFIDVAERAYFGMANGTVTEWIAPVDPAAKKAHDWQRHCHNGII